KYLTFRLGEEEYGIEILKVQEIIQMQRVTRVPNAPSYVRGVINLRGKVIPVLELRVTFGMPDQPDSEKTCIIVVQLQLGGEALTMGLIIDEVREVLDIGADSIEETPSFGTKVHTDFIMGIGKVDTAVKMLLDIDRIFDEEQKGSLSEISSEPAEEGAGT
ncbi:MAG: chemotaxis protein CheW, partial [Chitinivibrionales bacterium]|nr:chemotaxis protein CheW [Chitinivibrionales bacterium]